MTYTPISGEWEKKAEMGTGKGEGRDGGKAKKGERVGQGREQKVGQESLPKQKLAQHHTTAISK